MEKGSWSNSVGENLYVIVPMDRSNDDITPLLTPGGVSVQGRGNEWVRVTQTKRTPTL